MMRRFSAFLHVGAANRRYFLHHGVPEARLFFAPHAVDNARFLHEREGAEGDAAAWKRELGIPEGHAVILFAGKFEAVKRVTDLIRAYRAARLQQAALLLVGGGPLEAEVRREAAGDPTIFFAPFQNQTKMPRTWAAGDLVVLCSQAESWGSPSTRPVCLARPIIVSTHVGCAEDLVHQGQNGLVFPTGDVPALARCLEQALADRRRLRAWGQRSLEIVSHYSYEQTTAGLPRALGSLDGARAESPREGLGARSILLALPGAFGPTGGIEMYNRLLLKAFHEIARERGTTCETLLLLDAESHFDDRYSGSGMPRPRWFAGSRPRFAASILERAARLDPGLIVFGHVNFALAASPRARCGPTPRSGSSPTASRSGGG